jgi:Ca-activated chloride channel homolog
LSRKLDLAWDDIDRKIRETMRKLCLALFALLAAATPAPVFAQNQDDEKLVVGTNLVTVNVSVTDSRGRYVRGLTRDEFGVFDNKERQQVAHFSSEESPFSLGIVYDVHSATPEQTAATLRALKQFAATLRPEDDFFLLVFDSRGSLTVDFIPTAEQVSDHLTFVRPKGPAALYDAVFHAGERVRAARNPKRALLIISDGGDHNSGHSDKEVRRQLREFNIQVYGVGVADLRANPLAGHRYWTFEDITRGIRGRAFLTNTDASFGRAVLEEMARVSGGSAYFPDRADSEEELFGVCTQIALELRRQYTLGFYPTATASDARWHRLRVNVKPRDAAGKLSLSYREGYQLPKK